VGGGKVTPTSVIDAAGAQPAEFLVHEHGRG
jgi:hypothetical protein